MTLPELNIRAALSERLKPVDFVLPGLPSGSTGALLAPGGTGKTMLGKRPAKSS